MAFHDELLASAGSDWTDWRQFNLAWYESPTAARNAPSNYSKRNSTASLSLSLRIPGSAVSRPSGSRFWLALKLGRVSSFRFARRSKSPFPCKSGSVSRSPQGRALVAAHCRRRNRDPRASPFYFHLGPASAGLAQRSRKSVDGTRPSLAAPSDATAHEIENFIGYDLVHHRVRTRGPPGYSRVDDVRLSRDAQTRACAAESSSALKTLDKTRDTVNRASRMFGRTVLEDEIRSQDLRRQYDAARAELAGPCKQKSRFPWN
jgi:hypothetical protein